MVFFYISYLIVISLFCLPVSFRARVHLGDKEQPYFITVNVNKIFDFFPLKLKAKSENKHKKKGKPLISLKLPRGVSFLKLLTIYELKIVSHNISKYSETAYNIGLALLQQFVEVMRAYGNLYDFKFSSSESSDNMPTLQLKLHIKINLFIIFSSIFKIIKINKEKQ